MSEAIKEAEVLSEKVRSMALMPAEELQVDLVPFLRCDRDSNRHRFLQQRFAFTGLGALPMPNELNICSRVFNVRVRHSLYFSFAIG